MFVTTFLARDLETVVEVAESLNIHLDNLDFSDMYPEVKEDTPDVEKDKLTSSGMNPKEKDDNVTDVEVKEDNIYFSEMCQVVQRIDSEAKRVPSITSSSGGIHTNESVVEEIKLKSLAQAPSVDFTAGIRATEMTLQHPTGEGQDMANTKISFDGQSFADYIRVHDRPRKVKIRNSPYKCDVCGQEFNQKGNMKTHKINKHQYQPPKNRDKVPLLHSSNKIQARYDSVNQAFKRNGEAKGSVFDLTKVRNLQDPPRDVDNSGRQIQATQQVIYSKADSKVKSLQKTFRTGSITISLDRDDTNPMAKPKTPLNIVKGLTVTNPNLKGNQNVNAGERESGFKLNPTSNIEIVIEKQKKEQRTWKKSKAELICSECGKIFNSNSRLKEHSLVHSDIRPFICDICGKGFTRLVLLNTHRSNKHDCKK